MITAKEAKAISDEYIKQCFKSKLPEIEKAIFDASCNGKNVAIFLYKIEQPDAELLKKIGYQIEYDEYVYDYVSTVVRW